MGLVRTALIFGAGYVLGRPEGRAKMAELARRPEVAQLRRQAASTVASGVKSGKEQLTKAAGKDSEQVAPHGNDSGPSSDRRGRRLPSFPRRGARHAASAATGTASTGAARETPRTGDASSDLSVADNAIASTAATGTTTNARPTSTSPTARSKSAGTASVEPDVARVSPAVPLPSDSPTQ